MTTAAGEPDLALAGEVEAASLALVEVTLGAAAAVKSVSTLQLRLLVLLERHGPANLSALAARLETSVPSASRLVDRVVESGLVVRKRSAHSRREITVELTPAGRRTLAKVRRGRQAAIAAILARMSPADRDTLLAGLTAFHSAADEG